MHCQALCLLPFVSATLAETVLGVTNSTCPTTAPGPSSSLPGWDMSNFLYIVYDEIESNGETITTAHASFDIVGAFSNQPLHCEGTGLEFLANYTGSASRWRNCTAKDGSSTAGYTTSFRYNPEDWYLVTLRELSTCGADPGQMYYLPPDCLPTRSTDRTNKINRNTVLFRGDATNNNFRTNEGSRPEMPPGGTNVQTWTRTYYDSAHVEGHFTLIPPGPSTDCTVTSPTWEVRDFKFNASCFGCPPILWNLPNPGYQTDFRLRNLANNYEVGCSYFHSDLAIAESQEWNFCGVDPEDAPFLPATYFRMDRETHTLSLNQSWVCEGENENS